jgi:hypothetical protein
VNKDKDKRYGYKCYIVCLKFALSVLGGPASGASSFHSGKGELAGWDSKLRPMFRSSWKNCVKSNLDTAEAIPYKPLSFLLSLYIMDVNKDKQ